MTDQDIVRNMRAVAGSELHQLLVGVESGFVVAT